MPNPDGQDRDGQYQHIRENATDHYGYLWLQKLGKGVPVSGRYRIRVFEVQIEGPLLGDDATEKFAKKWFPLKLEDRAAKNLISEFASRAYRRPVTPTDEKPILELYRRQRAADVPPLDALQICYQTILCSPSFLYHRTKAGPLDQHELANRLSFFLWGSPADEELRGLAEAGRLRERTVLRRQTERLLDDRRSEQLVADFTDSWLPGLFGGVMTTLRMRRWARKRIAGSLKSKQHRHQLT